MNDDGEKKSSRPCIASGQAVIERVMVKSANAYFIAVRSAGGLISITRAPFAALRAKHRLLCPLAISEIINFSFVMMLLEVPIGQKNESFITFNRIEVS